MSSISPSLILSSSKLIPTPYLTHFSHTIPPTTIIGVATYSKAEYPELLALSEDRDLMDATWEEWTKSKNNAMKNLRKMGLHVVEVQVRLAELALYCREQGLKINGESRAMFAQKLVEERTTLVKKSQSVKK